MDYTTPPDVMNDKKNPANIKFDGVASGKKTEKSLTSKLIDLFVGKDMKEVKTYALKSVVVPKIKSTIVDIVCYILGTNPGQIEQVKSVVDSVSYNNFYANPQPSASAVGTLGSFPNIKYRSEEDAKKVLTRMKEIVNEYKLITINNWFDISEQDAGTNYQLYCNYGWRDLRTVTIYQSGGWWYLNLPKAQPINK